VLDLELLHCQANEVCQEYMNLYFIYDLLIRVQINLYLLLYYTLHIYYYIIHILLYYYYTYTILLPSNSILFLSSNLSSSLIFLPPFPFFYSPPNIHSILVGTYIYLFILFFLIPIYPPFPTISSRYPIL
jgi:hypothetical protein